jgi:hypothetical protein
MTTKATTARFVARYRELKFVRKASYNKEVDGRVISIPGEAIRFSDGIYETSDPAVIEFLENREEFGKIFIRVPDNVDALVHKGSFLQDLESKELALKKKEQELSAREAKLNASEEGAGPKKSDEFKGLKKAELIAIAEKEGVEDTKSFAKPGIKLATIIEAILEKRKDGDAPAY